MDNLWYFTCRNSAENSADHIRGDAGEVSPFFLGGGWIEDSFICIPVICIVIFSKDKVLFGEVEFCSYQTCFYFEAGSKTALM